MKKLLLGSASKAFLKRNMNLLTRESFQLFTAQSGEEILRLHHEHCFDLILADLHLHDIDGDAVCARLRSEETEKNVAVVLICYDTPEEHARVARCGADAKIIRPIQPDQVIEMVGSLLAVQLARTKRAIFKVRVLSKKGLSEFYCLSLDISITGILLEAEHALAVGDRIICQFTLPGSSQIKNEGDVVRAVKLPGGSYHYGIQFIALPLDSRREIENYIASVKG